LITRHRTSGIFGRQYKQNGFGWLGKKKKKGFLEINIVAFLSAKEPENYFALNGDQTNRILDWVKRRKMSLE
jgi:hypothetical protein